MRAGTISDMYIINYYIMIEFCIDLELVELD